MDRAREVNFSGYTIPIVTKPTPKRSKWRTWLRARLLDLDLIEYNDMATTNKPSGFFVNYTTVTVFIATVSFLGMIIGGLYKYTYDVAYQKGVSDERQLHQQQQQEKQEREIKDLRERLNSGRDTALPTPRQEIAPAQRRK